MVDWLSLFHELCVLSTVHNPKLISTLDNTVQIDKSDFRGRRKYNGGSCLLGNVEQDVLSEDEEGTTIPGPQVLGICTNTDNICFVLARNRSISTLIPLIKEHVQEGSTVWTDEWGVYKRLCDRIYAPDVVNHSLHFVNPVTSANTQKIERCWKENKLLVKKSKATQSFTTKSFRRNRLKNEAKVCQVLFLMTSLRNIHVLWIKKYCLTLICFT